MHPLITAHKNKTFLCLILRNHMFIYEKETEKGREREIGFKAVKELHNGLSIINRSSSVCFDMII